jgi:hypothetical protein
MFWQHRNYVLSLFLPCSHCLSLFSFFPFFFLSLSFFLQCFYFIYDCNYNYRYLLYALQNYCNALRLGTKHDLKTFRLISLW